MSSAAVELVRAGFALVPIPRGEKRPNTPGWQTEAAAIRDEAAAAKLNGGNLGIAHRWCRTCCVDVDDYTAAEGWLHGHGIDLAALLMADDAVQIHSGRPGRAKLLYRLPEGVEWLPTIKPRGAGVELRCATRDGSQTVQDVAPPSIHPDTGRPYEWRGDWRALPTLPPALLALWQRKPEPRADERVTGSHYGRAALESACRIVAAAPDGARNDTLNNQALGIAQLVAGGELGEGEAHGRLLDAARACGLGDPEILATLRSAFAAGMREPRRAPQGHPEVEIDYAALCGNAKAAPESDEPGALLVDLADLASASIDAPEHVIDKLLPAEATVTLLGGHGGAGKSQLALLAAVCLATGRPFLGREVKRTRVIVYSAEDGARVLRYRLARILFRANIHPDELRGWLRVFDLTDADPVLYVEGRNGQHGPTERYAWLREQVEAFGAGCVVVDNASDAFDASEISRPRVRHFIRLLSHLVKPASGSVLLLAHVDKGAAKAGKGSEGYSGSTAWNNSVRSRLYLYEENGGLTLEHQKANFGPKAEPMRLHWQDGLLAEGDPELVDADPLVAFDRIRRVLRLIGDFNARGESISTARTAHTSAFKMLRAEAGYPAGLTGPELFALLADAERHGLIARETYRTADRKERERWAVTAKGRVDAASHVPGLDD